MVPHEEKTENVWTGFGKNVSVPQEGKCFERTQKDLLTTTRQRW
jgi:hypothetical protein